MACFYEKTGYNKVDVKCSLIENYRIGDFDR